ncbi:cold shock domain-containing protein [Streptomyces sp. NPDC005438]|uniref:cold-shock protein n=1 Tax=Streptomyces sp. NPDC005438 TaxID=3156880 RepID=UPI0033B6D539
MRYVVEQGKVVRFDDVRGYGFIDPGDGTEDIFMHANDLTDEKHLYKPGALVEFRVEQGDRGLKASMVSLVEPAPSSQRTVAVSAGNSEDSDDLCDLLSPREFQQELTEVLLESAPTLTAAQIVQVRKGLDRLARGHGWLGS